MAIGPVEYIIDLGRGRHHGLGQRNRVERRQERRSR